MGDPQPIVRAVGGDLEQSPLLGEPFRVGRLGRKAAACQYEDLADPDFWGVWTGARKPDVD